MSQFPFPPVHLRGHATPGAYMVPAACVSACIIDTLATERLAFIVERLYRRRNLIVFAKPCLPLLCSAVFDQGNGHVALTSDTHEYATLIEYLKSEGTTITLHSLPPHEFLRNKPLRDKGSTPTKTPRLSPLSHPPPRKRILDHWGTSYPSVSPSSIGTTARVRSRKPICSGLGQPTPLSSLCTDGSGAAIVPSISLLFFESRGLQACRRTPNSCWKVRKRLGGGV